MHFFGCGFRFVIPKRLFKGAKVTSTCINASRRPPLAQQQYFVFLSYMDKTVLVETLALSEKNHSIVEIKIINRDKTIVGAVQKVLNQIIILKSAAAEPITLTFADIESINRFSDTRFAKLFHIISKTLHRRFRLK
jgi:hypothetical protein